MTWTRLAIPLACVLAVVVAGCGGGSAPLAGMADEAEVELEELTASAPAPDDAAIAREDTVIEADELADERRQVEGALTDTGSAADRGQADADVVAAQEARLATTDFAPYVETSGHAEFDGSDVRVFLPIYAGGYPVVLNSVADDVGSDAVASRLAGYSRRTWALFDNGPLAVVSVRWNDADDRDYLAAGWWVREGFGRNGLEAGAFVDGPELRGPLPDSLDLPLSGQAVYHGEAAGLYQTRTRVHCSAFPCAIPSPDDVAGEFAADAKLVANFTRGDVEGCVGCRQGIRFTPGAYDLDDGAIERGSPETRDYLFWLHRTGFLDSPHRKGAFAGDLTVVPLGGHASGYGYWQGRFSSLADRAGNPRLLGATLQGQFEDESTATRFSGVLSADSEAFGGRP